MESVRLLHRKAKKKRHFVNHEKMMEILPLTSTYDEPIINLQDDWLIDTCEYNILLNI